MIKAIEQNNYLVVKKLITHPLVSINAKEPNPLNRAVGCGHLKICELLIEYDADVNTNVIIEIDYITTPLHCAAWKGHHKIAELLIEKGADINARDIDEWTPLHIAA